MYSKLKKMDKTNKKGVILHEWGFYRISDNQLIASCYAFTYFEASSYFEEADLLSDPFYEIRIIK